MIFNVTATDNLHIAEFICEEKMDGIVYLCPIPLSLQV